MGSTTRGLQANKVANLALVMFRQMLPSLLKYAEPDFEYWVYVAADQVSWMSTAPLKSDAVSAKV